MISKYNTGLLDFNKEGVDCLLEYDEILNQFNTSVFRWDFQIRILKYTRSMYQCVGIKFEILAVSVFYGLIFSATISFEIILAHI